VTAIVFSFPGHEDLARVISARLGATQGQIELRRFPDGESYVRLDTPVAGKSVVLVCGLHQADEKALPLLFAAAAARELGAVRVGFVAPYLGYLRQDRRFREGEAVSSATFARIVSGFADWLVTVDPHLHRYRSLGEIYSLRTAVAPAAPAVSAWIRNNVTEAFLIGPDAESEQWVAEVGRGAGCPYVVLEKTRRGDREVEVTVPDIDRFRGRTPVLVDDIISTARTMIETVNHLKRSGMRPPVCIGVHPIFAGNACSELSAAGAARIVSSNTIAHFTNAIDINGAIAGKVAELNG
jgi:ribose-phosphate pyrophosphokinase